MPCAPIDCSGWGVECAHSVYKAFSETRKTGGRWQIANKDGGDFSSAQKLLAKRMGENLRPPVICKACGNGRAPLRLSVAREG